MDKISPFDANDSDVFFDMHFEIMLFSFTCSQSSKTFSSNLNSKVSVEMPDFICARFMSGPLLLLQISNYHTKLHDIKVNNKNFGNCGPHLLFIFQPEINRFTYPFR